MAKRVTTMIDLNPIAQAFLETFRTDEAAADKNASEALSELAQGDEAVYLGLRNQLADIIRVELEKDLMSNASESRLQAEGILDEEGFVTENVENEASEVEAPLSAEEAAEIVHASTDAE